MDSGKNNKGPTLNNIKEDKSILRNKILDLLNSGYLSGREVAQLLGEVKSNKVSEALEILKEEGYKIEFIEGKYRLKKAEMEEKK